MVREQIVASGAPDAPRVGRIGTRARLAVEIGDAPPPVQSESSSRVPPAAAAAATLEDAAIRASVTRVAQPARDVAPPRQSRQIAVAVDQPPSTRTLMPVM
jgi:hypothetical protein